VGPVGNASGWAAPSPNADEAILAARRKRSASKLGFSRLKQAEHYIEQYGERCWETDILPASVIEQALDDRIRSWRDAKLWQRRAAEIERARALL
jgi:hypothetical protein